MRQRPTVLTPRSAPRLALAPSASRRPQALGLLFLITLAAGVLRFSTLGAQSLWYDESVTAWIAHASLGKALGASLHDTTPPPYYVLVWGWAKLFSTSEVGLRLLPALAGTATVPAAYLAAAVACQSRRIGLMAAGLVATSPLLLWYSQEARNYAWFVFAIVVSLAFLAAVCRRPRRVLVVGWSLSAAAAIAIHYFAAFFVAAEVIWLLLEARRRFLRPAVVAIGFVACVGLVLSSVAVAQPGNRAQWIAHIPLGQRLGQIPKQFAVGLQSSFERPAELVAVVLCALALWALARRARGAERRGAILFAFVGIGAVAAATISVGQGYVITRNVLAGCACVLGVLAAGFGARRAPRVAALGGVVFCVLGAALCINVLSTPQLQRTDWRALGQALPPTPAPRLVVINYTALPLLYYLHDSVDLSAGLEPQDPIFGPVAIAGASTGGTIAVSELDLVGIRPAAMPEALCWWGAQCNLALSAPSGASLPPGFSQAQSFDVGQFTVIRYRSAAPIQLTARGLRSSSIAGATALLQQQGLTTRPTSAALTRH